MRTIKYRYPSATENILLLKHADKCGWELTHVSFSVTNGVSAFQQHMGQLVVGKGSIATSRNLTTSQLESTVEKNMTKMLMGC